MENNLRIIGTIPRNNHCDTSFVALLGAAEGVAQQFDPCEWWKYHSADIPMWARLFRKIALIHPSSAAAERVFSLLQSSFGKQQEQSLEDYIQLSVMMQYIIEMIISVDNHYNKVENNLGIMGYH